MDVKRKDITKNYINGKFTGIVSVRIEEYNPMLTKAKMEFIADVIEGVFKSIEASEAEYLERYGEEVIKNAHMVPADIEDEIDEPIQAKHVQSYEVQKKLLERAFP